MAAPYKIVTLPVRHDTVGVEKPLPARVSPARATLQRAGFDFAFRRGMGDGFRDRIWTYLDDPEFERHEGLRNALYRLLVASELPSGMVPAGIDARGCLDLAASAVREKNAAVIARACILVDDLVVRLAALAGTPTGGSEAWSCGSCN